MGSLLGASTVLLGALVVAAVANAAVTPLPADPNDPYYQELCPQGVDGVALQGDDANDQIVGTERNDLLLGGGGDDRIDGLGGDDCLDGEDGKDKVFGGTGDDLIDGANGHDRLRGGADADLIRGGVGDDDIRAANGAKDHIDCGPGDDTATVDNKDKVRHCETVL